MKKLFLLSLFFLTEICSDKKLSVHFKKEDSPLQGQVIVTNIQDIIKIAHETADFLKKIKKHPSKFVKVTAGLFSEFGITVDDVIETLDFIVKTGKKNPSLLQSPWFFNEYFTFYRWYGDETKISKPNSFFKGWEKPPMSIITTQYRITELNVKFKKTSTHMCPVYLHPLDENSLTREEVLMKKNDLIRFKYSFDQIKNGALDHVSLVKVIGWLDEAGYKDFIMQGSAELLFPNGVKKLIQVSGNNGMKGKDIYWFADYIAPVRKTKFPCKVQPIADVTYAGDIDLLGFGKIILLSCWNSVSKRKEIRLGILTDTGSAFKGNLAKLDMFTGYFQTQDLFKAHIKSYPHTARAYILIKKNKSKC